MATVPPPQLDYVFQRTPRTWTVAAQVRAIPITAQLRTRSVQPQNRTRKVS
jgi:hypothetical protein